MSQLDIEKNPLNLLKRIEELQRRLDRLERNAITGDIEASLGYGSFGTRARVFNSSNISISDSTLTALTFDSERYNSHNLHSTVTNTGRLTCQTGGLYVITGGIEFAANGVGNRVVYIRLNGSVNLAVNWFTPITGSIIRKTITTQYELSVGDYVELVVYQNSGGSLNVNATANLSPEFMMVRVP